MIHGKYIPQLIFYDVVKPAAKHSMANSKISLYFIIFCISTIIMQQHFSTKKYTSFSTIVYRIS